MVDQVRGAFFVAARAWLDEHHPDALDRLLARIPPEHRGALATPRTSALHSEHALAHALRALDAEITRGDRRALVEVMEGCTMLGLGSFLGALLRLASPATLLRRMPTIWAQLHPGSSRVAVRDDRDAIELRFESFPFFADPLYEPMIIGMLRALVRGASGRLPEIEVLERGADRLIVRVAP